MEITQCPECKNSITGNEASCPNCGFDIAMYKTAFNRFLKEIELKNKAEQEAKNNPAPIYYAPSPSVSNNIPKCPTCGSTNLSKISGLERAANAAMWGILGNRRKYHWHCNNCKYEW